MHSIQSIKYATLQPQTQFLQIDYVAGEEIKSEFLGTTQVGTGEDLEDLFMWS